MTSPTIRIRLAHQPPLYFVVAVVVASLLPVLFQLLPDASSAVALQRLPKLAAAPIAFERIDVPAFAVLDDEVQPQVVEAVAPEADEEIVIVEPQPRERSSKHRAAALDRAREPSPSRRLPAPRPGLEQRAKAACAAHDKAAARSAYRALPFGDERRRSVRKACRDAGIIML